MAFKRSMQALLQNSLGFQRYLYLLARFNLFTMRYSRRERDFMLFMSMLPNDGIVLDIGANIGVMTVPLGKKCSHGKIYAFEPVPENY